MAGYLIPKSGSIKRFKVSIENAWQDVKEAFFGVGDLLCAAEDELPKNEFRELINSLSFSTRTAQRLMAIARDSRLRSPKIQKRLPSCWGTVYEMHTLSDQQLNKLDRSGLIHAGVQRKEISAFKRGKSLSHSRKKSERLAFSIKIPASLKDADTLSDLKSLFEDLMKLIEKETGITQITVVDHFIEKELGRSQLRECKVVIAENLRALKDAMRCVKALSASRIKLARKQGNSEQEVSTVGYEEEVANLRLNEEEINLAFTELSADYTVKQFQDDPGLAQRVLESIKHTDRHDPRFAKFKYS